MSEHTAASAPTQPTRVGALGHVRICDLSGQLAGAGATRLLAAFGAEVIRVEDPVRQGTWDILRGAPPYRDERRGIELGGAFNNHNVNKLGVTLNLRTERGRELLGRLIAVSDVVTENFAAGVMARLGFPYDEMRRLRPDIIYVSNSGFGATGPYASFKSWGPAVQALCGLSALSALADQEPAGIGLSYMDHHGANFMALAVLAALFSRQRTGEGRWIDLSCTDAGATLLGPHVLDVTVNGRCPSKRPDFDSNRCEAGVSAPHGVYPCTGDDEWIALECRDDHDWGALRDEIAQPWANDTRFATAAGRFAHHDELDELLGRWTAQHDKHDLAARLQRRGVAAAAVLRPGERVDVDPSTAHWGLWPEVTHPEIGSVRVDGIPLHLSAHDWSITSAAPTLGQHNDVVFGGLLGVSDDELASLREEGVL